MNDWERARAHGAIDELLSARLEGRVPSPGRAIKLAGGYMKLDKAHAAAMAARG